MANEILDIQNRLRSIEHRASLGTGPSARFENLEYEPNIPPVENFKVLATFSSSGVTTVVVGWTLPDDSEIETFELWVKDISSAAAGIVKVAECREPPATLILNADATTAKTIFCRTRMRSGVGSELAASPTVTAEISVPSAVPGPNSVTNTMLQRSGGDPISIGTADIQNASITNAKIVDLQASKITAGTLVAGVIYAGTINATQVNAGTLSAVNVSGGTFSLTSGANQMLINGTNGFRQVNSLTSADVRIFDGTVTGLRGAQSFILANSSSAAIGPSVIFTGSGGGSIDIRGTNNNTAHIRINGVQVLKAREAAVTDPSGGATQDAEARTAIIAIIDRLQAHGLIS